MTHEEAVKIAREWASNNDHTWTADAIYTLLDEIERLKAQVAKWEKREIRKASCCVEMERERDNLRDLCGRLVEALDSCLTLGPRSGMRDLLAEAREKGGS